MMACRWLESVWEFEEGDFTHYCTRPDAEVAPQGRAILSLDVAFWCSHGGDNCPFHEPVCDFVAGRCENCGEGR